MLTSDNPSAVVLPCIFGARLEGSLLLATGKIPIDVLFQDEQSLRAYYDNFETVVVFVDERMTDNARILATPWRINAVFVVQMTPEATPKEANPEALLDMVNINAVTALAGPQSLILVQVSSKYYFYRGIANRDHLNTSNLAFGADVSEIAKSTGLKSLLDPRAKRLINLSESNTVLLPSSDLTVLPQVLKDLFANTSLDHLQVIDDDISAIVPQLQVLLNQKDLLEISRALISVLSAKVGDITAPIRTAYINFLTKHYKVDDPESVKKKNEMLGDLRRDSKRLQQGLESVISRLSTMMSAQTTSKRTHDLQRLQRQAAIQNNVSMMCHDTLSSAKILLDDN
jgi:hypothetical protein